MGERTSARTSRSDPPPAHVCRAFGSDTNVRLLLGGQGTSWSDGDVVLKPGGGPVYEWLAASLGTLTPGGVRIAAPVPTREGAWSCDGWTATRWVDGRHPDWSVAATWVEIVEAGRALHRAMAHLSRPSCLATRDDWWARADKAAWEEMPLRWRPELADCARRLQGALQPLGAPQVVHGDLTGNVLFAVGREPAVIDISPYWRPPQYAEGVVLADALCWHGAAGSVLAHAGVTVAAVARALLFRMATSNERAESAAGSVDLQDEAERYADAARAIGL